MRNRQKCGTVSVNGTICGLWHGGGSVIRTVMPRADRRALHGATTRQAPRVVPNSSSVAPASAGGAADRICFGQPAKPLVSAHLPIASIIRPLLRAPRPLEGSHSLNPWRRVL